MRLGDELTADTKVAYDAIVNPAFRARERAHWQARQQRLAAEVVLRAAQKTVEEADAAFEAEVRRAWAEVSNVEESEQVAGTPSP